jgi:hypothetical protein
VVCIAAAVVTHGGLNIVGKLVDVTQNLHNVLVLPLRTLKGVVQILGITGVVFVMMDSHRPRVNIRFERIRGVGKWG